MEFTKGMGECLSVPTQILFQEHADNEKDMQSQFYIAILDDAVVNEIKKDKFASATPVSVASMAGDKNQEDSTAHSDSESLESEVEVEDSE